MSAQSTAAFFAHGAALSLAWFFIVNVVAGALALSVFAALRRRRRAGGASSAMWLTLRLAPAISSVLFACGIFVPSYWRYEPPTVGEGMTVILTMCAAMGAAAIVGGVIRGSSAWRAARRRTRAWMSTARPLQIAGSSIPAFQVDSDVPIMALVGIVRPRLLVTRGLIQTLSGDELAASVAHEIGHARRRDNLKRLLMRAAPDLLASTRVGSAIERRWAAAAEYCADRFASRDPAERCALASALVKVARLMPAAPASEPISTLVGGGEIAARVRCLLDEPVSHANAVRVTRWLSAAIAFAAAAVAYAPMLRIVHDATEVLVRVLP